MNIHPFEYFVTFMTGGPLTTLPFTAISDAARVKKISGLLDFYQTRKAGARLLKKYPDMHSNV